MSAASFQQLRATLEGMDPQGAHRGRAAKLLANVDVNRTRHDGMLLLHSLCTSGELEGVRALLEAGADPALVSTRWGAKQTALDLAVANNRLRPKAKLALVKLLVEGGADVNQKSVRPNGGRTRTGSPLSLAIKDARVCAKDAADEGFDADARRYAKQQVARFALVIPYLVNAGSKVTAAQGRDLAALGFGVEPKPKPKRKKKAAKRSSPVAWRKKVEKLLARNKATRTNVYDALTKVLRDPPVVADAGWADAMIDLVDGNSRTFAEVSEDIYGEPVSFIDDEGSLSQGWDEYVILDLVLEALRDPATGESERWREVVEHVFRVRRALDATASAGAEAEALLAEEWVAQRVDWKRLVEAEKNTR